MEVPSIFLNRILSETTKKGASSLHFSVGSQPLARVDGRLIKMENEDIITSDAIGNILNSFISSEEKATLDKEKEVVIVKVFAGKFRFRVNAFYQKGLLSLSFNHIPGIIRSLEDLGLPNIFKEVINLKSGLLVVAGPHNSGRSTTAAAFIEELNKKEKKYIITIEDPIEYSFINKESIVEQRQVGRDVRSYSEGIRLCLDEDVE